MLAVALSLACAPSQQPDSAPEVQPLLPMVEPGDDNLLVISLDTARKDSLAMFSEDETTPFLTDLLEDAQVWNNHRSCSNWTVPSTVCLQTGVHPIKNGFWPTTGPLLDLSLPSSIPTLQRYLDEAGFHTSIVTANPYFSPTWGVGGDFDEAVTLSWERGSSVVQNGIDAAKALPDDAPWYLHLHFIDPHQPYDPPEAYHPDVDTEALGLDLSTDEGVRQMHERWADESDEWRALALEQVEALYQAELLYWDDRLEILWTHLEDEGLLDDTLVVFWTDHGEQLMERGTLGHKDELHVEETDAIVALMSDKLDSTDVERLTTHTDLLPTLLDHFGLEDTPPRDTDIFHRTGKVIDPDTPADADRTVALAHYEHDEPMRLSVADGEQQLFYTWDGDREFYETEGDPAQSVDLYDAQDPEVEALWDDLMPIVAEVEESWPELGEPTAPGP